MYDRDYQELLNKIEIHVERLKVMDLERYNMLNSERSALKHTLVEIIKDLDETATSVNTVLLDIAYFLDKKFSSPVKPKSSIPASKDTLKPWDVKI